MQTADGSGLVDASSVRGLVRRGAELLAAASREPRRDAALLLCHVLGRDRAWLLGHAEVSVTADEQMRYEGLLERRALAEPVQYIVGEQEFYGLRLRVTRAVLIPRPETEHLVEAVLGWVARLPAGKSLRIVDVGTGSGAIAVALADRLGSARVDAVDVSAAALEVARGNARAHGVGERVRFCVADLLEGLSADLAGERYDVVVANPPYVSSGEELERQVVEWEPHVALFAGDDGMDVYRRLVPQACGALRGGGLLAMEIGAGQAPLLRMLLGESGCWGEPVFVRDLQGMERVVMVERGIEAASASLC
jgi:release factor glutamine methyltransferase